MRNDLVSNTRFGTWETSHAGLPDFESVSTGNGTVNTGVNALTALGRYQMAAWLTTQYGTGGMTAGSDSAKALQGAIWRLLNPVDPSPGPDDPSNFSSTLANNWIIAAWTARATLTDAFYSRFRVITQTSLGSSNPFGSDATNTDRYQEFIYEVPEPGHLALLAVGLGGLFWLRRRRAANLTA